MLGFPVLCTTNYYSSTISLALAGRIGTDLSICICTSIGAVAFYCILSDWPVKVCALFASLVIVAF
jgi:hypothetical protein